MKTEALVKRLRKCALTLKAGGFQGIHDDYIEAADALDAQAQEIERLRKQVGLAERSEPTTWFGLPIAEMAERGWLLRREGGRTHTVDLTNEVEVRQSLMDFFMVDDFDDVATLLSECRTALATPSTPEEMSE